MKLQKPTRHVPRHAAAPSGRRGLAHRLTSRGGSVAVLLLMLLIAGAALGLGSTGSGGEAPETLPDSAESAEVDALLEQMPGRDTVPAIVVLTRADGGALPPDAPAVFGELATELGEITGHEAIGPIPSEDGEAVLLNIPVDADEIGNTAGGELVDELRATIDEAVGEEYRGELTGAPGFAADTAAAFEGADFRLLAATAAVVAVLLVITYRSPILWLVPLLVVGLADRVAAAVIGPLGDAVGVQPDASTAGITSVLVFGAGTNYALLLVARYREELRYSDDDRHALAVAWRRAVPSIVSSNATVVLALVALLLASLPNYRALGVSATIGLLVALAYALFALPAALAICGRGLFWPFAPKRPGTDEAGHDGARAGSGVWAAVARRTITRPVPVLVASAAVLVLMSLGLLGTSIGLSQSEQFRVETESAAGIDRVAEHFPAGATDPVIVLSQSGHAEEVSDAVAGVDGVVEQSPPEDSGIGWSMLSVTIDSENLTDRSEATVREIREVVHAIPGADAMVGGAVAEGIDTSDGNVRDLMVLVPIIVLIVFVALIVILRALIAPVVLMFATILSSLAAIGLGTFVVTRILGFPGLDIAVPLYCFLFLVALGIDYSIFLTLRARDEAGTVPTRKAMLRAVSLTGAVITSAGLVLASVFVVLGVLPLVVLTQVGVIVALGILLDTFLVRTVVVPALFSVFGPAVWWPGPARGDKLEE